MLTDNREGYFSFMCKKETMFRFKLYSCWNSPKLLPPQGFGPDGQNLRRHPRCPCVLGRKVSPEQKKSLFFKNRARKVMPKLRWGSKKHSKESGRGVFARDSELEREELSLNEN